MQLKRLLAGVFVGAVLLSAAWPSVQAQRQRLSEQDDWPLSLANVLPTGQPVIPIFESWYNEPNGTISLSFGYINLNSAQELSIPIGPDNNLEPARFNGMQPTHFDVAPKESARFSRHQSVFSVNIPKDYTGDVVWTLRVKGKPDPSPGRAKSSEYDIDVLDGLTEAPVAPTFTFGTGGVPGRGRNAFLAGPLKAVVGQPLTLPLAVDLRARPANTVTWYHHQGAGKVTFDPRATVLKANGAAGTTATFSAPGDYMLRVTGLESLAALEQHCCYTNGYVKVTVTQ